MAAPTRTLKRARNLRRMMSPPEVYLWNCLRKREPGRPVFRRQHPEGPYILDFYCAAAKLAVEVDGAIHSERVEHDERRDAWLREKGIEVFRIPAAYVFQDVDAVGTEVIRRVRERLDELS